MDIQGDFYELPNKLKHMPFLYNIASNCGIYNAPTMKVTPNANLPNLIIPYKQQNKSHQHQPIREMDGNKRNGLQ